MSEMEFSEGTDATAARSGPDSGELGSQEKAVRELGKQAAQGLLPLISRATDRAPRMETCRHWGCVVIEESLWQQGRKRGMLILFLFLYPLFLLNKGPAGQNSPVISSPQSL